MKINNYNDFLNEHYEFINEAMLIYTSNFKNTLNVLSKNDDKSVSKIANFLYSVSNTEIDKLVQSNIDVSDESDKVSFIPANKIEGNSFKINSFNYIVSVASNKNILDYVTGFNNKSDYKNFVSKLDNAVNQDVYGTDLFCNLYDENGDSTDSIVVPNDWTLLKDVDDMLQFKDYTFHYLQNTENKNIKILVYTHENNYLNYPTIKPNVIIPDIKTSMVKVGRFVNKIIELYFKNNDRFKVYTKSDFKPADVEKFVNAYSAHIMYSLDIESYLKIVEGEDIKYWYLEDNYQIISGQLGNSCMRHERCQSYFRIYTENPEVCKMLILTDTNNKLVARALLWIDEDGKKWMDRVYSIKDNTINVFSSWASKNGYEFCYGNSSTKITVLIKNLEYNIYPYVDTLYWKKDIDENLISLSNKKPTERPFNNLQYTDGSFSTYSV